MVRRREISPRKVRTGDWGDRQAQRPPYYVQINNRVVTPAEFERQKMEFMRGAVIVNPPGVPTIDWENVAAHAVVIFFCVCGLLWMAGTFIR